MNNENIQELFEQYLTELKAMYENTDKKEDFVEELGIALDMLEQEYELPDKKL